MRKHSPWLWTILGGKALGVPRGLDWAGTIPCPFPSFQVVDLLNQAALITNDSKITVLKQVRAPGASWAEQVKGRRLGT